MRLAILLLALALPCGAKPVTVAYQDLDEKEEFAGTLTTTEFLCRHIFDRLKEAVARGDLGPGAERLTRLRVTLGETQLARAWYEGSISD